MKAPNLHERIEADEGPAGPSNRKFGVSLGLILAAFAVFGVYFGRGWGWWVMAGGACLVILGLVLPAALSPLNRAWTGPEALPTAAELDDPVGWLARTERLELGRGAA